MATRITDKPFVLTYPASTPAGSCDERVLRITLDSLAKRPEPYKIKTTYCPMNIKGWRKKPDGRATSSPPVPRVLPKNIPSNDYLNDAIQKH